MKNCQKCNSERIVSVSGKTSDMCSVSLLKAEFEHDGYVPEDMNIGGGDYLCFILCLDCGQQQGNWPLPETETEAEAELQNNDPFKSGDAVEFEDQNQGELVVGMVESFDRYLAIVKVSGYTWNERLNRINNTSPKMHTISINRTFVKKTDKCW